MNAPPGNTTLHNGLTRGDEKYSMPAERLNAGKRKFDALAVTHQHSGRHDSFTNFTQVLIFTSSSSSSVVREQSQCAKENGNNTDPD